jgi:hypothetical protein
MGDIFVAVVKLLGHNCLFQRKIPLLQTIISLGKPITVKRGRSGNPNQGYSIASF